MVALVIVAFGMGAVLSALSSSADNISSLREKTLAQWVAMNQVTDTRLNLTMPQPGVSEGDVKGFGNGDWHWRQDVIQIDAIPGMVEIAVRVQRLKAGSSSSSSGSSTTAPKRTASTSSSGAPNSFFSSSGSGSYSSGGFSSGLSQLSSGGSQFRNLGASALPSTNGNQQWIATVIGFRGDSVAAPNGDAPDWSCNALNGGVCSGSSGASSSGATVPSPAISSSGGATSTPTPTVGSSGGN